MGDQHANTRNNNAANKEELTPDEREQNLRIEELELKIRALKKPEYRKITTWTGVVAIAVAVTGIVAQGVLYQIKSANAEKNLAEANEKVKATNEQAARLIKARDSLKAEVSSLEDAKATALKELEKIYDELSKDQTGRNVDINSLKEDINAAAINLRASTPAGQQRVPKKPLSTAIEELFSPKASTRGTAYNIIMTYYGRSSDLVPALLDYANLHLDNQNGIYNTLVVLGHLNYDRLSTDIAAIRSFAEKTKDIGPKTADRAQKILERLPK